MKHTRLDKGFIDLMMSESGECSKPKRQKLCMLQHEEIDIKTEMFDGSDSPDNSNDDEGASLKDQPDQVELSAAETTSPCSSVKKEKVLLDNITLYLPSSGYQQPVLYPQPASETDLKKEKSSFDGDSNIKKEFEVNGTDVKNELFDDGSDYDYIPDDDDDEGDSDEKSYQPVKREQVLLDNITLYIPDGPQKPVTNQLQPTISTTWSTAEQLKTILFEKQNVFNGSPGSEPIDFFNFFFEDELLLYICDKTNAHAAQLMQGSVAEHSRVKAWKDITIFELRIFLGLLFHMGTIPLSRLQDYWKVDRLFAIPIFRKQMARNRFLLILKCLHFTSDEEKANDSLIKIRYIIDYFNNKMEACYYPGKELCLDESMVLWKGRLRSKEYIKNKRQKYGIELFMLMEPDDLVLKFCVYAGCQDAEYSEKGPTEKVVMQLMENKLQNGHSLYMDNYYNSITLAKQLLENQTYCTGILRKDLKEIPEEILKKGLRKGENVSSCKDGVIVGKWNDKHPLMYVSTEYQSDMIAVKNNRGSTTNKPLPIVKYNEFMTGADRQIMSFYPLEQITLRWYLKLAIHTFQLLFLNSYKVYNICAGNRKKIRLYDYRLAVINDLLTEKSVHVPRPRRVQTLHTITRVTEKNSKGNLKRKICRQCSKLKKRKDTIWHCELCEGKPGLCVECFDLYHL